METLDIIIYAAIAAFLASRLWAVLGQRNEDDPPQRRNPFAPKEEDSQEGRETPAVVEIRPRAAELAALASVQHAPTSLVGTLDELRQMDRSFDEKQFLEGAKIAFTKIVGSFAAGDLSPVERFLGPAVRRPFEKAIEARKEKGQTLDNRIDKLVAVDIVAAQSKESVASLTVEFVSHQVNVLKDANGQIIEGNPSRAEEVRDVWVFERDTRSSNPNWQLVETRT